MLLAALLASVTSNDLQILWGAAKGGGGKAPLGGSARASATKQGDAFAAFRYGTADDKGRTQWPAF